MQCPKCEVEIPDDVIREQGYVKVPECSAEMPLAKNPFPHHPYLNAHSPEREQERKDNILHSAFVAGREAQRQLAIDLGYRPVPTIDLLAAKLAHIYKGQSIRMVDAHALHDALLDSEGDTPCLTKPGKP